LYFHNDPPHFYKVLYIGMLFSNWSIFYFTFKSLMRVFLEIEE
jgi:hypothetical protein